MLLNCPGIDAEGSIETETDILQGSFWYVGEQGAAKDGDAVVGESILVSVEQDILAQILRICTVSLLSILVLESAECGYNSIPARAVGFVVA